MTSMFIGSLTLPMTVDIMSKDVGTPIPARGPWQVV